MSKIELHYTPEHLAEINKLMRDRLIKEIKGMGIVMGLPSSQVENEIRVVNHYFDDINTILSRGEFIRIEKGSIIDEMVDDI